MDMEHGEIYLEANKLSCMRDDRILFSQLSFVLKTHQALLLEGKNGSGKTTLLRILCGFREADEGCVTWCGQTLNRADFYATMAYVGHMDGVKKELSVLENLQVALALGTPGHCSIEQALDQVYLGGYDDTPVYQLSAGQRRRLSLARLLITKNTLWVLDEPFTSLDKQGVSLIENIMTDHIQSGGMVVLTSHHDLQMVGVDLIRLNLSACP